MAMRFRRFRFVLDLFVEPRDAERLPVLVRLLLRDLHTDEVTVLRSFSELERIIVDR